MRKIGNAVIEGIEMLRAIGIEVGEIRNVRTSARMTRSLGLCRITQNMRTGERWCELVFAPYILREEFAERDFMDTVLHELLHSVEGCHGHGGKWKLLADRVNRAYGYSIQQYARPEVMETESLKVMAEVETVRKSKLTMWKWKCLGCGKEFDMSSRTKFCKNPDAYHCRYCKGKFKRIG